MKTCIKALAFAAFLSLGSIFFNPVVLADSGPGSGDGGGGHHADRECEIEAKGKGFITIDETDCFHFEFKFEFEDDETKAEFKGVDQESGVCFRLCRVIDFEKIDDRALLITFEAFVGEYEKATIIIKITDGKWGPDTFELTLEDVTVGGDVHGKIKIEVECKEKCKGGVWCKGHPYCDEHPYCKGKKCKGHKDCRDRDHDDDDDYGDDGDDYDGNRKCKGHPECKPKCKGKQYCKGHPKCDQHSYCEVPNCKGHKNCKKKDCQGHTECRKNYKHKNGCKAKASPKYRCSCKSLKT